MQNILGRKIKFIALFLFVIFLASPVLAEREAPRRPQTTFSETAAPVFDLSLFQNPQPEANPFFDELRKEREKFLRKQQFKKREFVQEVQEALREGRLTDAELQKKLEKFHKKNQKTMQKYLSKEQKKIAKHNQEI